MLGFSIILIIIRPTRKLGIAFAHTASFNHADYRICKNVVLTARDQSLKTSSTFPVDISEDTFSLFCAGGFDASYPSGHSARAAAVGTILAIALATKFPRGAPLLLIYPAMMAFSRIYVLQHYPSDVIGGALLGVLLAGIVAKKTHLDDSKS